MSDHYIVEAKVEVRGSHRRKGNRMRGKEVIRSSELSKEEVAKEYQEKFRSEWNE